jgi:hypothetical protein
MSEWWSYSLSDFLLFSPRTYYRLFELYNTQIWPLQIVAALLALALVYLVFRDRTWAARTAVAILIVSWLWVAWAYLLTRYDTINWAASYFAVGFAVQAALLAWTGMIRAHLRLRPRRGFASKGGVGVLLFAVLGYPLIAPLAGRPWTQAELFAIAPDPTVLATLGVLLAAERMHWALLVIPLLWCAISGATLSTMQSPDAPVLIAAAGLVLALVLARAWQRGR